MKKYKIIRYINYIKEGKDKDVEDRNIEINMDNSKIVENKEKKMKKQN